MRKRCVIISLIALGILSSLIIILWFPPVKKITVSERYSIVTNRIAQWRPARASWRGLPSDVRSEEKLPGSLYFRSIFERGDPKFGPFTVVQVSKFDETHTTVELYTMQYSLFGILGRRHRFFTEQQRWKEIQELVHQ